MTIAKEYKGNGTIKVENGQVYAIGGDKGYEVIGKIGRVELSIEHPEQMLEISRVEHVMVYDENDKALYEDQGIVNNDEYHSDKELVESLAKKYGISKGIIDIVI